jgi:fructose-bisphosphate aldolase class I
MARANRAAPPTLAAPCTSETSLVLVPSPLALEIQAETLAQFAGISQKAGLVPIAEPDVDFSRVASLVRTLVRDDYA